VKQPAPQRAHRLVLPSSTSLRHTASWTPSSRARTPASYLQTLGLGRGEGGERLDAAPASWARPGWPRGCRPAAGRPRRPRARGRRRGRAAWTRDGVRRTDAASPAAALVHGPSRTLLAGPCSRPGIHPRSVRFTAGLRQFLGLRSAARSPRSHRAGDRARRAVGRDGVLRHALRHAGWRPGTPVQPPRTRQIDLRADEAALWGDLRKKWRQYGQQGSQERDPSRRRHGTIAFRSLLDLPGNGQDGPAFIIRTLRVLSGCVAGVRKARDGPSLDGRNPGREGLATLSSCASAIA